MSGLRWGAAFVLILYPELRVEIASARDYLKSGAGVGGAELEKLCAEYGLGQVIRLQ